MTNTTALGPSRVKTAQASPRTKISNGFLPYTCPCCRAGQAVTE